MHRDYKLKEIGSSEVNREKLITLVSFANVWACEHHCLSLSQSGRCPSQGRPCKYGHEHKIQGLHHKQLLAILQAHDPIYCKSFVLLKEDTEICLDSWMFTSVGSNLIHTLQVGSGWLPLFQWPLVCWSWACPPWEDDLLEVMWWAEQAGAFLGRPQLGSGSWGSAGSSEQSSAHGHLCTQSS